MSAPIKDGGAAFPVNDRYHADGRVHGSNGMTLRDYFAGQALSGYLASASQPPFEHASEDIMAAWCYQNADAMLAARERKEGNK